MSTIQKYPQTYYTGITKSAQYSLLILDYISWRNGVHPLSLYDDVVTEGIPYFLLSTQKTIYMLDLFLEWRPTVAIIVWSSPGSACLCFFVLWSFQTCQWSVHLIPGNLIT